MIVRGQDLNWYDLTADTLRMHESDYLLQLREDAKSRGFKSAMGRLDVSFLYAVIKWAKPRIVVETGTYVGMSSTIILRAMLDAGVTDGVLYTIDPNEDEDMVGCLIPDDLRPMVKRLKGKTEDLIESGELPGKIDAFLHDSVHRYPYQYREFEQFWDRLRPGGVLISHDVNMNSAFTDFVSKTYGHDERGVTDDATTTHAYWGRLANLGYVMKC